MHEREVEVEALDQTHERIGLSREKEKHRETERDRECVCVYVCVFEGERVMRASVRGIVQGQTPFLSGCKHILSKRQ